jgi:hypothetical protein
MFEHRCSSVRRRERDFDSETTTRSSVCGDDGVVCIGDSLRNGESKPEPAGRTHVPSRELLERLEQSRHLGGGDPRPGVHDREQRLRSGSPGGELDPAADRVVLNRVVEKVVDEALEQIRIADRHSPVEPRSRVEPSQVARANEIDNDRPEVDGLAPTQPVLTPSKYKTRVEQAFLVLASIEDVFSDLSPSCDVRLRVGQRELEQRALGCQGRAQLVSDVGGEASAIVIRYTQSIPEPCSRSRAHRTPPASRILCTHPYMSDTPAGV